MNEEQIGEFLANSTKGAEARQVMFHLVAEEIRNVFEKKKALNSLTYNLGDVVAQWMNWASFFEINDDAFTIFSYFMLAQNCEGRLNEIDGVDIIDLNTIFDDNTVEMYNKLAKGILH